MAAFLLGLVALVGGGPPTNAHRTAPPASAVDSMAATHSMDTVIPASAMQARAPVLSRAGWTATASDEETTALNGHAANVLDGSPNTFWHSLFTPTPTPLPHWIQIDMHQTQIVSALVYTPRAGGGNGTIGSYAVELSMDGTAWSAPVISGAMADDATAKTLSFAPQPTRFVRLTALSEAGNRGPWSSAGEINLLGDPGTTAPTLTEMPRTGWGATASDQETTKEDGRAANVLDGNPNTFWHSLYTPTPTPLPHWIQIDMRQTQQVGALLYTPRPRGGIGTSNGTIGSYTVSTSLDGTTFTQVASGTWPDDATTKTATFSAVVPARYVRLTALSEAGNRGPWSSAAEINILGENPALTGSWGSVIGFPLVPVAAALLPNNKLLVWSAYRDLSYRQNTGMTQTAILDLATGAVSQRTVTNTDHDMFCPGIAVLPDGRVMVTGGDDAAKTSIYDPATDTWATGPEMNIPRGYQAMTTLSDGDVFVLGGSWNGPLGGKNGEIWSHTSDTWNLLPGVPDTPALTNDPKGIYRQDNHMWLYATSNGRVLQAGPSSAMNWIDTSGAGTITPAGRRGDSPDAMNGNAVAYDINKILTLGGATAYSDADATNRAYRST
ncbi:discoidin domain-containing protein [Catenulispora rubra]|uniref:discoidin domain-containing protein n=1 Tax=Catenulispora rubra TaxID=280293 RepID=UPI001E5F58A4|nr:discoidin domain-containing protein [Catenulispora rubra]